jgi:hypothetical protein
LLEVTNLDAAILRQTVLTSALGLHTFPVTTTSLAIKLKFTKGDGDN